MLLKSKQGASPVVGKLDTRLESFVSFSIVIRWSMVWILTLTTSILLGCIQFFRSYERCTLLYLRKALQSCYISFEVLFLRQAYRCRSRPPSSPLLLLVTDSACCLQLIIPLGIPSCTLKQRHGCCITFCSPVYGNEEVKPSRD